VTQPQNEERQQTFPEAIIQRLGTQLGSAHVELAARDITIEQLSARVAELESELESVRGTEQEDAAPEPG
jgi:uncharacterized coiled-coil protein SlyX